MTTVSSTRELSDGGRVIDASYRSRSDLSKLIQFTSESSSSSASGVTTPVDGVPPTLIAFPKSSPPKPGLTSSGSSSSSLDRHRVRSLSFSRAPQSPTQRTSKLSFGSVKATPTPAVTSTPGEHQPLAAFSLTSSAEGHLRTLVTRAVSPRTFSRLSDTSPRSTFAKRERASSLRSLPLPWASISDIDEEEGETFWPRQKSTPPARRHDKVPSLSRSPSTPKGSDLDGQSSSPGSDPVHQTIVNPRMRFASERSVTAPRDAKSQANLANSRIRANSLVGNSVHPRAVANLRLADAGSSSGSSSIAPAPARPPRTFLRPPVKSQKGKSPARSPPPGSSVRHKESTRGAASGAGATTLDPALAAAENASRLRAKCVCVVCGKLGTDFPRCPRCPTTWCSRACRVSDAPAGSARHSCNGKSKNVSGKGPATPNLSPLSVGA